MLEKTSKRTGARRRDDIPPDVLDRLNSGTLETATLSEGLAVDFARLMERAAPTIPASAIATLESHRDAGITRRMALAAEILLEALEPRELETLERHPSDTVRGWAAFVVGVGPDVALAERLRRIRPLADDPHFGVREWAWLAVRPHIAARIDEAVELLRSWTLEESENVRRFAVEGTRPRGVWCAHIQALKDRPERGLPLLEPLRSDASRYVRLSVANWLNDASKSNPEWVRELCRRWEGESPTTETAAIVTRALRSIGRG